MVTAQPQQVELSAIKDTTYNGMDGATSLNMPSFAPEESQQQSAQTDEIEDAHQVQVVVHQEVSNQLFIETCPVTSELKNENSSW